MIHERPYPFYSFLQLVIDEEREVLGRPRVEIKEVLEVACDGLFKEPIIVEGLLKETVETGLQVQQALQRGRQGVNGDDTAAACISSNLTQPLTAVERWSDQKRLRLLQSEASKKSTFTLLACESSRCSVQCG